MTHKLSIKLFATSDVPAEAMPPVFHRWIQQKSFPNHLLIDVAQDTSPRQWDIVAHIISEFTSGAGARDGIVRYGLYQQDAAMMTCFTPSALRSDHVHFIDGARGGSASAAEIVAGHAGVCAAASPPEATRTAAAMSPGNKRLVILLSLSLRPLAAVLVRQSKS